MTSRKSRWMKATRLSSSVTCLKASPRLRSATVWSRSGWRRQKVPVSYKHPRSLSLPFFFPHSFPYYRDNLQECNNPAIWPIINPVIRGLSVMLKHGNAAVYFSNYLRLSRLEVKEKLQWFGSGMLMMPGSCRYWYLQLICEEMNTTLTGSHRLLMVTVGLLPVASGGSADMHEKSSNCRNLVTTSFTIRTWFLCGFSFVLLPQSRRLCFCKRWPVSCMSWECI